MTSRLLALCLLAVAAGCGAGLDAPLVRRPSGLQAANPRSAVRGDGEDFQAAAARSPTGIHSTYDPSAYDAAVPFSQLDFSRIPAWSSADLSPGFVQGRDPRFIQRSNLDRRESWLFPDDGCWARAALMEQRLALARYPRPGKVFAFGNLAVTSPNQGPMSIRWWYHVAPVVLVDGNPKVLDPALNPNRPLALREWLLLMVPALSDVKVALCGSRTFDPSVSCFHAVATDEADAHLDQVSFLDDEWQRQVSLHRDPMQVLGDSPPWLQ